MAVFSRSVLPSPEHHPLRILHYILSFSSILRALADLEAEARAMGATVPPPPNPMLHNRSTAELAPGGRGFR